MLKKSMLSFGFLLSLFVSSTAFCWGDLGHQIVGAIAEDRMEPQTKAFIAGVLGIEPMAFAATWADAVRSTDQFNHNADTYDQGKKDADDNQFSDYHFADVPTGNTYDNKPVKDLKDAFGGLNGALTVLRAPLKRFPQASRIIALRYIIHLVGDIHQPLHVGNGYDIGANFCSVFWQEEKQPVNLHQVWDGMLISELGKTLIDPKDPKSKPALYYSDFLAAFKKYRTEKYNQTKPADVSVEAIKSWINESAEVRETTIYPDTAAQMAGVPAAEKYKHRPYCMWLSDKKNNVYGDTSPKARKDIAMDIIPRLDKVYIATNVIVVENQLIHAGVRLAALLDDVAREAAKNDGTAETVPLDLQQTILKSLQSIFHNDGK